MKWKITQFIPKPSKKVTLFVGSVALAFGLISFLSSQLPTQDRLRLTSAQSISDQTPSPVSAGASNVVDSTPVPGSSNTPLPSGANGNGRSGTQAGIAQASTTEATPTPTATPDPVTVSYWWVDTNKNCDGSSSYAYHAHFTNGLEQSSPNMIPEAVGKRQIQGSNTVCFGGKS